MRSECASSQGNVEEGPDVPDMCFQLFASLFSSRRFVPLRKPIFSYIDFEPGTDKIVDIREKEAISRHANTGAYAFPCGDKLRNMCRTVLDNPVGKAGEFYTSSIIQEMIRASRKVGWRCCLSIYQNRIFSTLVSTL